jgi:hypothetical protein
MHQIWSPGALLLLISGLVMWFPEYLPASQEMAIPGKTLQTR